jgi:hypothetical protein
MGYTSNIVCLSGILTAIAPFFWSSALLVYPLILIHLIELIQKINLFTDQNVLKQQSKVIVLFLIGWVMMLGVLLLPILPQLHIKLLHFQTLTNHHGPLQKRTDFLLEFKNTANNIIYTAKLNPFLFLAMLVGLIGVRNRNLVIVTLFASGLVIATAFYSLRCIYLLPYFISLMVGLFQTNPRKTSNLLHRRVTLIILLLTLIWCISLSLIVRPAIALSQYSGRNPDYLSRAGVSLVGAGSEKVYLGNGALELYYVGRRLGWKMYRFEGHYGHNFLMSTVNPSGFKSSVIQNTPQIDLVITSLTEPDLISQQLIKALDLRQRSIFPNNLEQDNSPKEKRIGGYGASAFKSLAVYSH